MKFVLLIHSNPQPWGHPTGDYIAAQRALPKEQQAQLNAEFEAVMAEMQEKGAQNAYMTKHIEVSDDYAYYQAKKVRANLYANQAELLASLPNAAEPATQARIAAAKATAQRLEDDPKADGGKQVLEKVEAHKVQREQQFHRYELFEIVVGALQIAIVLASVSVVTRIRSLAHAAGLIGAGAIVCGVLITIAVL